VPTLAHEKLLGRHCYKTGKPMALLIEPAQRHLEIALGSRTDSLARRRAALEARGRQGKPGSCDEHEPCLVVPGQQAKLSSVLCHGRGSRGMADVLVYIVRGGANSHNVRLGFEPKPHHLGIAVPARVLRWCRRSRAAPPVRVRSCQRTAMGQSSRRYHMIFIILRLYSRFVMPQPLVDYIGHPNQPGAGAPGRGRSCPSLKRLLAVGGLCWPYWSFEAASSWLSQQCSCHSDVSQLGLRAGQRGPRA
jgi:hypothetical protein